MTAHWNSWPDAWLEGRARAPGGGRWAANYMAANFQALGLEPAARDGSYFQSVALVGMTPHPSLVWGRGGTTRQLTYLDDFVAWAERPESHVAADGEVVFVGYGIQAAEGRGGGDQDGGGRGEGLLTLAE